MACVPVMNNTTLKIMSNHLLPRPVLCVRSSPRTLLTEEVQILGKNPPLHFALLRLQLVELIRSSNGEDIADAVTFAQEQLGPRAPASKEFTEDLELTM